MWCIYTKDEHGLPQGSVLGPYMLPSRNNVSFKLNKLINHLFRAILGLPGTLLLALSICKHSYFIYSINAHYSASSLFCSFMPSCYSVRRLGLCSRRFKPPATIITNSINISPIIINIISLL